MPKKGKARSVKHEDHALLLWVAFKGLCIMNLFGKEKVSTNINALTHCGVCSKMCSENYPKSGIQGIGFSNMTVPPPPPTTKPCPWIISGWKQNVSLHPPYSPNLAACDFFLFRQLKMMLKRRKRKFNDTTEFHAKGGGGGALAEIRNALHYVLQWCDCSAHCIKPEREKVLTCNNY
jgi:hypothetical protein